MYVAVVLTPESHKLLLSHFEVPSGWEPIAHHMTCSMGSSENSIAKDFIGQKVELIVRTIAQDELVMAVGVETIVPSTNRIKHITVGVNRKNGGKPFLSNNLKNWEPVLELKLEGFVQVVT